MGVTAAVKRIFVGRPMSSGELEHTLLPKVIALPVFASDPLSSVTYATQEVLLVLGTAGVAALSLTMPIAVAVAALLAIVVTSYRQTVRAYPTGGGAYIVARENLGMYPGLFAGGALLIDYILTVAVSTVAGVDAIVSAAPNLDHLRIPMAIGFVVFVALINLRGVKESGVFFAIPTYGFVLSIYFMLASGVIKCLGGCPIAESASMELHPHTTLSFFLILKAFSAGTTALTGVEAISDGVAAFRYPQSRNAATTLAVMGVFSISMFLGISWLANSMGVVFSEESERTVVAQIAHAIFGGGPMFYLVQVMSAAILVLAANTAFQDFPRLSSILARDRFMPRQFSNRGDRLVFSNGVVILTLLSCALIVIFKAELNRLIQLYLVGVFISFTFSQSGMVLRWRKVKGPHWKRSAVINGVGGTVTGVVLFVVIGTKFLEGAWIVVSAIPLLVFFMRSVHKHYEDLHMQLEHPDRLPADRRPGNHHLVILVPKVDAAAARAIGYARSIRPRGITAVTLEDTNHAPWRRMAQEIPIVTLPKGGRVATRLKKYLREQRSTMDPNDFLTVLIPEVLGSTGLLEIIRRPGLHRLKASLLGERGVQVLDIPILKDEIDPTFDETQEPARNYAVVLVSGVHNGTLQAIEYAETLRATNIRALSFGLDPAQTMALGNEWLSSGIQHPLEIEDSPFRDIGVSLLHYLRQFKANGKDRIVTVVIPEFVVSKKRHQILHNQTALTIKRRLLFEPGIMTASVPYHLED
ncbi:MAG TPA: APC family permease [Actinomycetota bacterium]|nr:APC family permease [Actinomycetota bacterium]